MKKKITKLSLTKETLRSLDESKLNHAAGGATEVGVDTCPARSCAFICGSTRCSQCCP